ncbi:MAG: radical SAM protein, partial [Candidatus Competibacterales bacterium]|nr:radical SAM protein [Candidatus Competibacterales bacterium]
MQVHLSALGCRLNEAELEQWAQRVRAAGHAVVTEPEAADLVVLNTCAVTGAAARKSRQAIRRLHRRNPAARLVVSGCQATLEPARTAAELGVDLVVPNPDKDRLVERVSEVLDLPDGSAMAGTGAEALFARGRSRAFVKVQDGCRYQCTFCITTVARGAERSRPLAEVVAEVDRLHADGVAEVVLTGVQLGGYRDPGGGDLAALLAALLRETEMPRIRLGSLEPWGLDESFFALFEDPRLMPHLHLPLQSGSDRVLRRMARRCW